MLKDLVGSILIIDASATVYYLLTKLFKDFPSLNKEYKCVSCSHQVIETHTVLTANLIKCN